MRFVGRLISRLVQLVVLLVILAVIGVATMAAITTQRGWATTTGTIEIAGLQRPVSVVRDRYGIIQITGDDEHDIFMAQGYVHAQERMWQMEISRRIGAGRLSELFGKSQIERDTFIRTLGWRVAAQRDLDAMSPESIAILEAYSAGVNAWITEHNGKLSTPFVVAGLLSGTGTVGGFELEPWTPLDTATWQKVQAWSLGGNLDTEIFRLLADARLKDPAKTDELFPAYAADAPVITPTNQIGEGRGGPKKGTGSGTGATTAASGAAGPGSTPRLSDDNAAALTDLANLGSAISALAGFDGGDGLVGSHGVGSNDWVVSGSKTLSGKPILANDPHLGYGMPSVWIINGLHCRNIFDGCKWDVVGVTFPGAPGVVLGHNAHIAWGATNVNPDTQDLFLEKADATDPKGYYVFEGKRIAYAVRPETIKVAGGPDVVVNVRSTSHGVVLSDVDQRLKGGPVLSFRWTTTAEVDLALESFFQIDRATNFDEFKSAFADYGSPSQNFIYADTAGHIGYVLPGLTPVRDGGAQACPSGAGDCRVGVATGERVRDGTSGEEEWTGYIPRDELPWQLDPDVGQIVSANNAPVDGQYLYWLGRDWDPGYRAARITQRLADLPAKMTSADMRSIQLDTYVLRADKVMAGLEALGPAITTDDGRLLWDRMLAWNRQCDVDSLGCAAYINVELALQRGIFDDELGPLARDYVGSTFAWEGLIALLGDPTNAWWAVTTSDNPTNIDAAGVAGRAIDATAAQLRTSYGDPAGWTWGRMHQVAFKESTLGSSGIKPLELYFDTDPQPIAGADGAILNTYYRISDAYPDPYDAGSTGVPYTDIFNVTNGPSYRLTIDMGDIEGAQIVITTGQSGNAFDTHYRDMIPLWAAGQSVPLPFSAPNVAASTVQTLTLSPP